MFDCCGTVIRGDLIISAKGKLCILTENSSSKERFCFKVKREDGSSKTRAKWGSFVVDYIRKRSSSFPRSLAARRHRPILVQVANEDRRQVTVIALLIINWANEGQNILLHKRQKHRQLFLMSFVTRFVCLSGVNFCTLLLLQLLLLRWGMSHKVFVKSFTTFIVVKRKCSCESMERVHNCLLYSL